MCNMFIISILHIVRLYFLIQDVYKKKFLTMEEGMDYLKSKELGADILALSIKLKENIFSTVILQ